MARPETAAARGTKLIGSAEVDAFMATLVHPQSAAIEVLRQAIRGADPSIVEGIKWKAPSFHTTEYFATAHLRARDGIGVILHLGAKVRDIDAVPIADPEGLLTWLAKDRAIVTFTGLADVRARKSALQAIVRQWIRYV